MKDGTGGTANGVGGLPSDGHGHDSGLASPGDEFEGDAFSSELASRLTFEMC